MYLMKPIIRSPFVNHARNYAEFRPFDITINCYHRSIRDNIVFGTKAFLALLPSPLSTPVSFDNKNKNLARLDSDWLISTTPTSIRKYVAKILSQVREKRGASEKKNDFPSYVSWIYRIFFFPISLSRWQSRDRIGKDCEFFFFFTFFISLCLTCTGRTRSQQSVYSWRICRNSATLPCTRSSRNSSSRNGSTPAREAPCTLDRFWNERRRWGRLCINRRKLWLDFEINHWKFEWIERIHVVCVQHYKFNNGIKIWDYNIFTCVSNKYNFSKSLYYFWLSLNIIITL